MIKIQIRHKLYLIIILILAGGIYFYNLDKESLLTDEYFSLYNAEQSLTEIILGHQKETNPNTLPPLYEIIMHFWLKIFGTGEFPQRSFSAFLGIVSVYIIYRLSRLLFDEKTGLLACLFAALSFSWFSFFRQNRCYSLFICLSLLSFYLFFYYLKNKQSRLSFAILIITNICLVYTHYFAFLVVAIELLLSTLEIRRDVRRVITNILQVCLWIIFAYIPWYPNLFYDINREPLMNIKIYYSDLGLRLYSIATLLFSDFHIEWDPLLTLLYIPLLIIGWIKLNKAGTTKFRHLPLCLALIFLVPFITIYLVTLSDRSRYYAPFSFPLFMLLALGIQQINKQKLGKVLLLPIVVFTATFNFIDFYDFFHNPLHENWKQAAQYIKEIPNYKNEEMVFVFQTKYNPPVFAYYYWDKKIAVSFIDNINNLESYEKDLSTIDTKHKIYLITDDPRKETFFEKLELFPEDTWIWIFRYHDYLSPLYIRLRSNSRYFFHQIPLNPEVPQIDFFLLKKIKK